MKSCGIHAHAASQRGAIEEHSGGFLFHPNMPWREHNPGNHMLGNPPDRDGLTQAARLRMERTTPGTCSTKQGTCGGDTQQLECHCIPKGCSLGSPKGSRNNLQAAGYFPLLPHSKRTGRFTTVGAFPCMTRQGQLPTQPAPI